MKLTTATYTASGTKSAKSTLLPGSLFAVEPNQQLMAQALRVYLANQRQGTRRAQTRADVKRTTAKIYRQKGTGKARHGSRKAPIFVGGGKAHGPNAYDSFKLVMPKAMKRMALCGALTQQHREGNILVLDQTPKTSKTKDIAGLLNKIVGYPETVKKVLMVLDTPEVDVITSVNNLKGIQATQAHRLNIYEALNHSRIIFTKKALESLTKRLGEEKKTKPIKKTINSTPTVKGS